MCISVQATTITSPLIDLSIIVYIPNDNIVPAPPRPPPPPPPPHPVPQTKILATPLLPPPCRSPPHTPYIRSHCRREAPVSDRFFSTLAARSWRCGPYSDGNRCMGRLSGRQAGCRADRQAARADGWSLTPSL